MGSPGVLCLRNQGLVGKDRDFPVCGTSMSCGWAALCSYSCSPAKGLAPPNPWWCFGAYARNTVHMCDGWGVHRLFPHPPWPVWLQGKLTWGVYSLEQVVVFKCWTRSLCITAWWALALLFPVLLCECQDLGPRCQSACRDPILCTHIQEPTSSGKGVPNVCIQNDGHSPLNSHPP